MLALWAWMYSWFTPTVLFLLLNLVIGTIVVTSKGIRRVHAAHPKDEHGLFHHHFPRFDDHHPLVRSPSSVLERLKSIGSLYRYRSGDMPPETAAVAAPADATLVSLSHREDEDGLFHHRSPRLDDPHPVVRSPSTVLERLKSIGSLYRYRSGNIPPETEAVAAASSLASRSHREYGAEEVFETLDDAYHAASQSETHFSRSQSDTHPTGGKMPVKLPAKLKKSASTKSAFAHFEEEEVKLTPRPATTRPSREAEDEEVDAKADDFINRFRQQLKLQRLDSLMRYKEMLTRGK